MEDITDSSGRTLFDNLTWFVKKLCYVMTSVSTCEHMWSISGWIHSTQQTQEQIVTTNCGENCSCSCQPRSEEDHDGKEQERGDLRQSVCNH
jgi:hypothetical protein